MEIKGGIVILLSAIAAVTIAFMFLRKKNRATSATDVANLNAASESISSAHSESTTNVTNETSLADSEQVAKKKACEVFLSFFGEDTRNQFTDFLYTSLKNASIQTFSNNEELKVGEEIGPELLKAIKESKLSIPILSTNYASSKWCLLELAEMVDCHKNGEHMIYPIFYNVSPSDVRNQRGSYELAFCEHRKKYDKETVNRWTEALKTVGELKGLELKKETNGRQGEIVKKVTEEILVSLKKNYTIPPKNLVGIEKSVEKLKALLKLDSGGVRIVGIHGMGGLGKTTLAKATYNQLCDTFERHYFIENVRENSGSDIQGDKVSGRKVLLVLDDVDNYSQVDKLMGSHSLYGPNSRIIITTRDEKILRAIEMTCQLEGPEDVCSIYKPDYMSDKDSLQLFSKFAFMRDSPAEGFERFSKEVVSIAAGLPLVLVVLGSLFFPEKDISLWEAKLKMCRMKPVNEVLKKLKMSFDALENEQKNIFLDIACFFIGEDVRYASYMWDDCNYIPQVGIRDLISKSLITVDDDNIIGMHDQLRDLGREIVRQEGLVDLGSQSRLWLREDAIRLLESSQEAQSIEALSLSVTRDCIQFDGPLLPSSFHGMPHLRYLHLEDVDLEGDFEHLFSNLRWLDLRNIGNFIPTNLQLKNIVILRLTTVLRGPSTACWQGLMNKLNMGMKLKVLDLSECHHIRELPHLAAYTSLEILNLWGCRNMRNLDGLEQLKSLKHLCALACNFVDTLPNLSNLTNLVRLELGCEKIDEIKGLGKLGSLEYLHIKGCDSLEILPDLSNLRRLKHLVVYDNPKLIIEVDSLNEFNALEVLNLEKCGSLKGVLDMSNMCNLREVDAPELKVSNIPNSELLQKLQILFNDMPIKLHGDQLNVSNASMRRMHDLSCFRSMKEIEIHNAHELITIEDIGELESLETFSISCCQSIEILLILSKLRKLRSLIVADCKKLIGIQGLDRMESLKVINIRECPSLERFHGHAINESLERLVIEHCRNLREISDLQNFKNLIVLGMFSLGNLTKIDGLEEVKSLECLACDGCNSITRLPELTKLEKLGMLYAVNCVKLTDVNGLDELKSLEYLIVTKCDGLKDLSYFPNTKVLRGLLSNHIELYSKLLEFMYNEEVRNLTGSRLSTLVDELWDKARNNEDIYEVEVEEDSDAEVEEDYDAEVEEGYDAEVEEDYDAEIEEDSDIGVEEDFDAEAEEDFDAEVEEDFDAEVEEDWMTEVEEGFESLKQQQWISF